MHGTLVRLYIALAAFDFFVVLFGIIFLLAVEKNGGHRYSALPWIILIIPYIIYESAVNIYYFSQEFQNINTGQPYIFTSVKGYLIVPLVYWVVKDIILFIGWWCVVSRLCYWNHPSGDDMTVPLTTGAVTPGTVFTNGVGPTDSFGPIYYNGGSTQVQIHDNPRQNYSHFDVVRPTPTTPTCQAYSSNWGRPGGVYGRDGGVYGSPRYM